MGYEGVYAVKSSDNSMAVRICRCIDRYSDILAKTVYGRAVSHFGVRTICAIKAWHCMTDYVELISTRTQTIDDSDYKSVLFQMLRVVTPRSQAPLLSSLLTLYPTSLGIPGISTKAFESNVTTDPAG